MARNEPRVYEEYNNRLWASEMCFKHKEYGRHIAACPREIYLKWTGNVPKPRTVWSSNRLEIGKWEEVRFLMELDELGVLVVPDNYWDEPEKDKEWNKLTIPRNGYTISGRFDAVTTWPDNKVRMYELKTLVNKWAHGSVLGLRNQRRRPYPHQLAQLVVYILATKDTPVIIEGESYTIDEWYLRYVLIESLEVVEFRVWVEGDVIKYSHNSSDHTTPSPIIESRFDVNTILSTADRLHEIISKQQVPDAGYKKEYQTPEEIDIALAAGLITKTTAKKFGKEPIGDMRCNWCAYRTACNMLDEASPI